MLFLYFVLILGMIAYSQSYAPSGLVSAVVKAQERAEKRFEYYFIGSRRIQVVLFYAMLREGLFVNPICLLPDSSLSQEYLSRIHTLSSAVPLVLCDSLSPSLIFTPLLQQVSAFQLVEELSYNISSHYYFKSEIYLPNENLCYQYYYKYRASGHTTSSMDYLRMKSTNRSSPYYRMLYGDMSSCNKEAVYRFTWVSKISENEWIADSYIIIP